MEDLSVHFIVPEGKVNFDLKSAFSEGTSTPRSNLIVMYLVLLVIEALLLHRILSCAVNMFWFSVVIVTNLDRVSLCTCFGI